MQRFVFTAALGAASLGLAACGDSGTNTADAANGSATQSASAAFPTGARIVEENGVTYRVDADGTRVRLGANESRIVVENDVRYRVDPDGSRIRISDEGVAIDVDLPDVDVGINEKGNPDVDVGDRDPDGGR